MIDPALREDGPAISSRMLRQFAGLWLTVFGGLALWNLYIGGSLRTISILGFVALSVGLTGLIRPSAIRIVFAVAMAVTKPIGLVISYAILATLYYVVFTPIALVFRIVGRDALERRQGQRPTHWVERVQPTDPRRYLHQS
jgi:hypothetical protein